MRGIDYIRNFRENIPLYKESDKQHHISNLSQKYLTTFYNMLAAYYLKCSELERDEVRDELNMEANQYINKAMDISYQEPSTCIIRGYSSIISGQIAQAEQEFNHVIHQNNRDILSALGKAIVCFNKEQYEKALEQYKKVIQINPLCPLPIYNASALCLYKIGNSTQAKLIFEKVLQKDPDNESALCGLAMVDNGSDSSYFENLTRVFQKNQNNPNILLALGETYLQKDELERAENLAKRGLQIVESMTKKDETRKDMRLLHSNLLVLLGKILHSKEDFNKAFKYYDDAVNICDTNPVALHYLGTMNLHLRNYVEAEKNFEKVLKLTKVDKDSMSERNAINADTMKILAQTKARMFKREEAIELLDTILENNRSDIDAYLEAAHLTEQHDYDKAINYYTKALKFLEKKKDDVRAQKQEKDLAEDDFVNPIYYNNLAVLYMKKEKKDEAYEMIGKARETLKTIRKILPQSTRLKAISMTLYFNEACHFESIGAIGDATNIYKYIIKEEPYYVDAYLRLAILAKNRGGLSKAVEYAEKAARYQVDQKPVIPYCVLGNFYLDQQQDAKAEKEFVKAINKNPNDAYAYLSIGNIIYNYACRLRDNPKKQEDKLREALKRYMRAMECDDSNAFAAVGIGNIIGEYGMANEAMEIYRVVRENHQQIPHAMVNSGHILASEGQIPNALKLYEKALEIYYNGKHDQIELWMAKLHYQSKSYDDCERVLKRMIQRNPSDIVPRFNLALCLQSRSIEVLNKDFREVKETRRTIENLKLAKKIFSGLIKSHSDLGNTLPSNCKDEKLHQKKEAHSRILRIADERLFFIKDTLQNSDKYLQHDMQQEQKIKEKQEENIKKIRELEEQEKKKEEEERQRQLEEQRIRDQKAEESAKAIEQLAKEWAQEEAKKQQEQKDKENKKKRDKKKKKYEEDGFIEEDESSGEDKDYDVDEDRKKDYANDEYADANMDYAAAENLGLGGLDDLKRAHKNKKNKKQKKEKKDKKEKKEKKDKKNKKHKKSRLKRMARGSNMGEGDNEDVFGGQGEDVNEDLGEGDRELKRQKFADE